MKTKTIKQAISFNTTPIKVYEMLTNAEKYSQFAKTKVEINPEINGTFSVFDGYCHGYTIELIEGEKIVQAWHFAEDGWPEDHFSICTFYFELENNKTKLYFEQSGIPEHKAKSLFDGWEKYYWKPMKEYIKNGGVK